MLDQQAVTGVGVTYMAEMQQIGALAERVAKIQAMAKLKQEQAAPASADAPPAPASATVIQLPLWPEPTRGTPNAWLRGALFAAIQGKLRQALKRELLATVDGIEIRFTGWQLDQSDMDVWETLVHLARMQAVGSRVEFSAYSILKALGRSTGTSDRNWLKDAFARLAGAVVEITAKNFTYFGSLLKGERDELTGRYSIELDAKILALYQAGWTQIEWDERSKLRRKPLALWLHGWYCSHAAPYPLAVATIQRLSGSTNSQLASFRRHLGKALDDLKAIGAVVSWEITPGDLVRVTRTPSPSQRRHLVNPKR